MTALDLKVTKIISNLCFLIDICLNFIFNCTEDKKGKINGSSKKRQKYNSHKT